MYKFFLIYKQMVIKNPLFEKITDFCVYQDFFALEIVSEAQGQFV